MERKGIKRFEISERRREEWAASVKTCQESGGPAEPVGETAQRGLVADADAARVCSVLSDATNAGARHPASGLPWKHEPREVAAPFCANRRLFGYNLGRGRFLWDWRWMEMDGD